MKITTVRLPDLVAGMLVELAKKEKRYRDVQSLFKSMLRSGYVSLKK